MVRPRCFDKGDEFNYRGWVTVECPNSADPVAEMANAVAFLRSL